MNEVLNNLLIKIDEKLLKIDKENKLFLEKYVDIQIFEELSKMPDMEKIENFELIEKIYPKLKSKPMQALQSLEEYKKNSEYYKFIKSDSMFESDKEYLKKFFHNLFVTISNTYFSMCKEYSREKYIDSNNTIIKNSLITCKNEISELLNGKIVSSSDLKKIFDVLKPIELLSDEECLIISNAVTMNNALLMKNKLKLKESKIIRIKEEINKKIESSIIVKSTINTDVKTVDKLDKLSDEQIELYTKIDDIIKNRQKINNEAYDYLKIMLNLNVDEKINIYETISSIDLLIDVIVLDLKENYLSKFLENDISDEVINDSKKLLKFYSDTINKIETKFDYEKVMKDFNLNNELEMINNSNQLLLDISSRINSSTSYINQFILNLNNAIKQYISLLKNYYLKRTEENNDLVFMAYEELENNYNNLNDIYIKEYMSTQENKNQYEDISNNFYSENNSTNLILFFDQDETITSVVEKDIEDSKKFVKSNVYPMINDLTKQMSISDFGTHSQFGEDHHIKGKFENICRNYDVRFHAQGDARIFYTKYKTNIGDYLSKYKNVKNIVIIFGILYGSKDGKEKEIIFNEAGKRLYDNENSIKYIKELFNINDASENKRLSEIEDYVKINKIKFGHLLETSKKYINNYVKGGE